MTVLLAVGSVFYLFYDATTWRLTNALPNVSPGYKKQIYANIGLAFIYPTAWQIEDYAFRFSGGDMELISDRDGITETQGIKLGLENIAEHHWADPESQFQHVRERLKKCQPFGQQKTSIANGRLADLFTCSVPIADGKKVDAREYYYQLSKCINLKIVTWSELTGNQRSRFDSQRDEFLSNMRLDDAKLHESGEFCIAHY